MRLCEHDEYDDDSITFVNSVNSLPLIMVNVHKVNSTQYLLRYTFAKKKSQKNVGKANDNREKSITREK